MAYNTRKIVTLLAVLIVGAMMSGCVEFHEKSTVNSTSIKPHVYTSNEIPGYLTDHSLSAGFGDVQIIIHPDKTVTVGNEIGSWTPTGRGGDRWSCSIRGINNVEALYLYTGRGAELWTGEKELTGWWFR